MSKEKSLALGEKPLAGVLPRSPGPKEPFSSSDLSAQEKAEHSELVSYAAEIGKMVEPNVLKAWDNQIDTKLNSIELRESVDTLVTALKPHYASTRTHRHLVRLHQVLARPGEPDVQDLISINKPDNQLLATLFSEVDQAFETSFEQKYDELVRGNYVDQKVRYLTEGALILGKKILSPDSPFADGSALLPNIRVYDNGIYSCQFDGILIPRRIGITSETEIPIWDLIRRKTPWAVIEVKTSLGASSITGDNKIKRPVNWQQRDLFHKIGKMALIMRTIDARYNFHFPQHVSMVYLRGVKEDKVHTIHLNSRFFRDRQEAILYRLREEAVFSTEQEVNDALELVTIYQKAEENAQKKEKSQRRKRKKKLKESPLASKNLKQTSPESLDGDLSGALAHTELDSWVDEQLKNIKPQKRKRRKKPSTQLLKLTGEGDEVETRAGDLVQYSFLDDTPKGKKKQKATKQAREGQDL